MKNRAGVQGNSCFGAAAGHAEHAWWQQPGRTHRLPPFDRGASPLKKKEGKQQKKTIFMYKEHYLQFNIYTLIFVIL